AGGRDQVAAEIEEVEGGHGLQDVALFDQNALNLDDAPEPQDRLPDFFLRNRWVSKRREHRVELPQDLFEPQLVSLMNDDEEHLVVGRPAMEGGAPQLLASEQPIELEVVRVVERAGLFAGLFFFHLASLRTTMPGEIQRCVLAERFPDDRGSLQA